MTKSEHRVRVDNGKYTFVVPADDYRVSILRYGKPWHGPQGEASNALHAAMYELDAARVVVQAARQWRSAMSRPMHEQADADQALNEALALHDRLTTDREPPSAWCGGEQPREAQAPVTECNCAGGDAGGHDLDCEYRRER